MLTSVLSAAEFGRVRAFVAVAETRSFTRAARALGVSPSNDPLIGRKHRLTATEPLRTVTRLTS
ncbi:MAG: LysR family transcriptional regulator [Verrucomicrobia bacterium]|nr:LysR family transcriptional regulator [Verrucomicrobiota bacterium]